MFHPSDLAYPLLVGDIAVTVNVYDVPFWYESVPREFLIASSFSSFEIMPAASRPFFLASPTISATISALSSGDRSLVAFAQLPSGQDRPAGPGQWLDLLQL